MNEIIYKYLKRFKCHIENMKTLSTVIFKNDIYAVIGKDIQGIFSFILSFVFGP